MSLEQWCAGWQIQDCGSREAYESHASFPFHCGIHRCDAWDCFDTDGEFPPGEALKYDSDKPEVDMVPNALVYGAARAFMYGANKYSKDNWRLGMEWSRLRNAIERHLRSWWEGDEIDESGLPHLDHCAASLAMLMAHVNQDLGKDNRPKATGQRPPTAPTTESDS